MIKEEALRLEEWERKTRFEKIKILKERFDPKLPNWTAKNTNIAQNCHFNIPCLQEIQCDAPSDAQRFPFCTELHAPSVPPSLSATANRESTPNLDKMH